MSTKSIAVYLYANALMYGFFAVWQTFDPWGTATVLGFEAIANAGKSEYLVVYGGFQFGLAMFFVWAGRSAWHRMAGLMLAVLLYVPIVPYRIFGIVKFWPVSAVPLVIGSLEALLLISGLGLLFAARGSMSNQPAVNGE